MQKVLMLSVLLAAAGILAAQTYLIEDFEAPFIGQIPAPPGWVQGPGSDFFWTGTNITWQRNVWNPATAAWQFQRGITPPGALSGNGVLWIDDVGIPNMFQNGCWYMRSPILDLSLSVAPCLRFWYFNAENPGLTLKYFLMVSGDGGANYDLLTVILNGFEVANNTWNQICIKIPYQYRTSQFCFSFDMFNMFGSANNPFIDMVTVDETGPILVNSVQSGDWVNPATWAGGIIPTSNNSVMINAGHTVTITNAAPNPGIIARCQDLIINPGGILDYGAGPANLLTVLQDIWVYGTLNAFNGASGRMVYCGGNFNILPGGNAVLNTGSIIVTPRWIFGTPGASGITFLNCQPASFANNSGLPVPINNLLNIDSPREGGSFAFESPVTVSGSYGLYLGLIDTNGLLTLGNRPEPGVQTIEIGNAHFFDLPVWNDVNVTSRDYVFRTPPWLPLQQVNYPSGYEIERIPYPFGENVVTGTLTMDTFNNLELTYPLRVGTETTGGLSLESGIIITTPNDLLTLSAAVPGDIEGVDPGAYSDEVNASYIAGPLKREFPLAGNEPFTFPLGEGTVFANADPSPNVYRPVILSPGIASGQAPIASILDPPSGPAVSPLTAVVGARAYRIDLDSGVDFPPSAAVTFCFKNDLYGGGDNIPGQLENIRLAQAPTPNGPWTVVSGQTGTGSILPEQYYSVTSSLPVAPFAANGEYFCWATTVPAIDLAATGIVGPGNVIVGIPSFFDVYVANYGYEPQSEYTVRLFEASTGLLTVLSGTPLEPGATAVFTFAWTPPATGNYAFQGSVAVIGDADPANDQTGDLLVTAYGSPDFFEDFEESTFPPPGWTVYNLDTGPATWQGNPNYIYSHSGGRSARHYYSGTPATGQNGWLVTSPVALPPDGNYALYFWNMNILPERLVYNGLKVNTTGDPLAPGWVELWSQSDPSTAWTEAAVNLSAYCGSTVYFAFVYQGYNADTWYLDDVGILTLTSDVYPPVITHLPLLNTPREDIGYAVTAQITDDVFWNNPLGGAAIFYSTDGGASYDGPLPLLPGLPPSFTGFIPAQPLGTAVDYYIEAWDALGNVADSEEHTFIVDEPAWLAYDAGGTVYLGYTTTSYDIFVLFENPFYDLGLPLQVNYITATSFYATTANPQIYAWDGVDWSTPTPLLPISPPYVSSFLAQTVYTCDLATVPPVPGGVAPPLVTTPFLLVAFQNIAPGQYFLFDHTRDYGTTFVRVGGTYYSLSNPGSWCVSANVSSVKPELSIELVAGVPTLFWEDIPGAEDYNIWFEPFGPQPFPNPWWLFEDGWASSPYPYYGPEDKGFFKVTANFPDLVKSLSGPNRVEAPTITVIPDLMDRDGFPASP